MSSGFYILTKSEKFDRIIVGSAETVGGCPPKGFFLFPEGTNFIIVPPRTKRRVVLPMEYLVILVLLLVVATGYIEAVKK